MRRSGRRFSVTRVWDYLFGNVAGFQQSYSPLGFEPLEAREVPTMVSGIVYRDLNSNNAYDVGEPGVPGLQVNLYTPLTPPIDPSVPVASTTTNPDGTYSLDVSAGGYTVRVRDADGIFLFFGGVSVTGSTPVTTSPLPYWRTGSTTTVSTSSSTVGYGMPVTFTATVTPLSGNATPSGRVYFYDGATLIGTGELSGSGVATLTTSALAVGSHSITAAYAGSPALAGSGRSAPITQIVNNTVAVRKSSDTEEGDTEGGVFRFTRIGDLSLTQTLNYTIGGTATAGSDFTGLSGSVTFGPGESVIDRLVTANNDTLVEWPETVVVTLSPSSGIQIDPAAGAAALTILDNDTPTASVNPNGSQAPTITFPGNQASAEGGTVSLPIAAIDPLGRPLTFAAVGLPAGLTIDPGTGVISGVIDYAAAETFQGNYTTTVVVGNGAGQSASTTFIWSVANTNRAPILQSVASRQSQAGDSVSVAISASDSDQDQLFYGASGLPDGVFVDTKTGVISGAISPWAGGTFSVTVSADDGITTTTATFTWTVTPSSLPSLAPLTDRVDSEGISVSFGVTGSDPNGLPLTYEATGLPPGISINPTTGVVSGTLSGDAIGTWGVSISVNNGVLFATKSFDWQINSLIQFGAVADRTDPEGASVSFQIPATVGGATGVLVTYSANNLPPGLSINPSTGTISGVVATGAAQPGAWAVSIQAQSGDATNWVQFNWFISRATNSAPTVTNPGGQTTSIGASVELSIAASDVDGDAITYTAAGLPPSLSIDPSLGVIYGTLEETDLATGPYVITVTATDSQGVSASVSFNWTVQDVAVSLTPLPVSGTVGADAFVPVATLSDAYAASRQGPYEIEIDWADGTKSQGIVAPDDNGTLTVYGRHTYATAGTRSVGITFTATGGTTTTVTTAATISAAPMTMTGGVTATAIQNTAIDVKLATLTDANLPAPASSYTVSVLWSDGVVSGGYLEGQDGVFYVHATRGAASPGSLTATITVTSAGGLSAQTAGSLTVGNYYAGQVLTLTAATFQSSYPATTLSATVNWGDGQSTTGVISPGANGTFVVTGTHAYGSSGEYSASVTVTGPNGQLVSSVPIIRIADAPLSASVTRVALPDTLQIDQSVLAVITDANMFDSAGSFSALVSWGDGSTSAASVVGANGLFRVIGSHTYAAAPTAALAISIFRNGVLAQPVLMQPVTPPPKKVELTSFIATAEKKFNDWAVGGKLTKARIDVLIGDPTIKGQDAATLAVLRAYLFSLNAKGKPSEYLQAFGIDITKWNPAVDGLTKENLAHFAKLTNPLIPSVLPHDLQKMYDDLAAGVQAGFDRYMGKIQAAKPTQLFGKVVSPRLIQQGATGDCAMLSATISLIYNEGEKFRNRIKDTGQTSPDGLPIYRVTFGSAPGTVVTFDVVSPTQTQLALYSSLGDGSYWLSIWEKAYVEKFGGAGEVTWLPPSRLKNYYNTVENGEALIKSVAILTGFKTKSIGVKLGDDQKVGKAIEEALGATPRFTLLPRQPAAGAHYVITTWTRALDDANNPYNLVSNHAYAILGLIKDADTGVWKVQLRNPWGQPGRAGGTGEIFLMPLADFCKYFQELGVQVDQKTPR